MPYRLLFLNIPLHVGEEEFYDYVRAHVGGDNVVNALLITKPIPSDKRGPSSCSISPPSTGAALVDYDTKSTAELAMHADFFVDGVLVSSKPVGALADASPAVRCVEEKGRAAYKQTCRGLIRQDNTPPSRKRTHEGEQDEENNNNTPDSLSETDIRLVGMLDDTYGKFLNGDCTVLTGGSVQEDSRCTSVDLFMAISTAIRRATLGELLSLRRISADEVVVRVSASTADRLLDRGHIDLGKSNGGVLSVHRPRPLVRLDGGNFELVKKNEVLVAMGRLMEMSGGKVAGFVDPFGNLLLPATS